MGNTTAAKKPAHREWSSFLFLRPGRMYGVECVHFPLVFEGMTKALFSLLLGSGDMGNTTAAKKPARHGWSSFLFLRPGRMYGVECVHFPLVFEGMTKALFSLLLGSGDMGNTTAAKKPARHEWSSFLFLRPGSVYGVECVHFPLVFEGMTKALFSLLLGSGDMGNTTAAKKPARRGWAPFPILSLYQYVLT